MWRLSLSILIVVLIALAGCGGGIEWFPEQTASQTPDAFSFKSVTCAKPGVTVTSAEFTVSGLTGQAAISIVNGSYGIADSTGNYPESQWHTASGTVTNGTKIKVRHTTASASLTNQTVITVLTIGTRSAAFVSNIGPYMTTSNQTSPACGDTPVYEP